jgi:CO/xanthine dehydrogenase Mo-binding subunit
MEPLNCTVHVTPTSAEAWIGTQVMERVHAAVAKAAGLPESQVTVHNHLLGGGFGRKLEPDMAYTAARIAKQVEGPVKVVWTREEDTRHDFYRPAYRDLLWARLEGDRIVGWKHRVSGSSVNARFLPAVFQKGVDPDGVASAQDIPYDIPNLRVEFNLSLGSASPALISLLGDISVDRCGNLFEIFFGISSHDPWPFDARIGDTAGLNAVENIEQAHISTLTCHLIE